MTPQHLPHPHYVIMEKEFTTQGRGVQLSMGSLAKDGILTHHTKSRLQKRTLITFRRILSRKSRIIAVNQMVLSTHLGVIQRILIRNGTIVSVIHAKVTQIFPKSLCFTKENTFIFFKPKDIFNNHTGWDKICDAYFGFKKL